MNGSRRSASITRGTGAMANRLTEDHASIRLGNPFIAIELGLVGVRSLPSREHPPQRRDQPLEFDRLGVELVASGAKRLLALAGERVRGERNDRDVARLWIVLQSSRRLPAVDHRYFEIH